MATTISNPGFLIDLDALLINSEDLSEIAFEKMCAQLKCNFTQEYHSQIHGTKWQFWTKSFIERFNLNLEPEDVMGMHTRILLVELDDTVQLMPGALALLDWIDSRTYAKALVTSLDTLYAKRYLEKVGILGLFDSFVTSEDVKNGKPDPEPYLLGASRLDRNPSDCFVFEDSVNGAISGNAAGATVFGVPTHKSDKEMMARADYLLSYLEESIPILENLGL